MSFRNEMMKKGIEEKYTAFLVAFRRLFEAAIFLQDQD